MANGDMLKVGLTGLAAFQRSLNTIGHNISNVNTEGYSRQRTILTNNDPSPFGNGFVGNGVRIITTERMYNDHAVNQVRSRTSSTQYFSVYSEFASQIDNLLADQDAGLAPALEDFFDSVQGVADDPTSIPAREVMITQSQAMVDRIHTMDDWFQDLRKATNDRLVNQVSSINALASQIADMNQEIIVARGIGQNNEPNDLLDQRDTLINQLSEHIGISIVPQDDGSLNIFMGGGQSLVLGTTTRELEARPDPDDPTYYEVTYKDKYTSSFIPITDTLKGGDLGGAIAFRNEILLPAQNYLGWISNGLSRVFNEQHQQGIDLNDNFGGDYFVEPDIDSMISSAWDNTGGQTLSLATVNFGYPNPDNFVVADTKPASYRLEYDGVSYVLHNETDGTKQTLEARPTGVGTSIDLVEVGAVPAAPPYPNTFPTIDGMHLQLTDVPNAGDTFYIHAARDASRKLDLVFKDPNLVAAAQPLRTWIDSGNDGKGANSGTGTYDVTISDTSLLGSTITFPASLVFSDSGGTFGVADQVSINGAAPIAYAPGMTIGNLATDGWQAVLKGNPNDGDQYYIDSNGGKGGNQGTVDIGEVNVSDIELLKAAVPSPITPVNIIFSDSGGSLSGVADQYSVDGGATWNAYVSTGTTISFPAQGWDVTLSGDAWVGDVAYVTPNTAGSGDNRNARSLAELQLQGSLIGGNATFHEGYSELVTSVGNRTQQAEINSRAQEALLNQSIELRESISGVNLDEEAANLLKFQQAYAAAAQVIAAADNVFQTLISAVRR